MPHTKSAEKRLRQALKRRIRNRATKKTVKQQLREFHAAITEGTPEEMQAEYNLAAKRLDQAAAKGVIHRNLAARKKSQLAKLMSAKKAAPPAANS